MTREIAVRDEYEQIGYLSRELVEMIAQRMDRGEVFECVVTSKSGGGVNDLELNVVIYNKENSTINNVDHFNDSQVYVNNNYHYSNEENNHIENSNSETNYENTEDNSEYESDYDNNDSTDDSYDDDNEDSNSSYDDESKYSDDSYNKAK